MTKEEEIVYLANKAISRLAHAVKRIENPEGPPYRGNIEELLKEGSDLAKEAWQLYKKPDDSSP